MSHGERGVQRPTAAGREALELSFAWWHRHRQYMAGLQAATGLSPMEIHALRELTPGEATPTLPLAERIHCEPSNISAVLDRLQRAGLIARDASGQDRRVRLIRLTDDGVAVRDRIREYLATPPAAINRLAAADQRALRDVLRRMLES